MSLSAHDKALVNLGRAFKKLQERGAAAQPQVVHALAQLFAEEVEEATAKAALEAKAEAATTKAKAEAAATKAKAEV